MREFRIIRPANNFYVGYTLLNRCIPNATILKFKHHKVYGRVLNNIMCSIRYPRFRNDFRHHNLSTQDFIKIIGNAKHNKEFLALFTWKNTAEGFKYWSEIYDSI